eukprot:g1061.t1
MPGDEDLLLRGIILELDVSKSAATVWTQSTVFHGVATYPGAQVGDDVAVTLSDAADKDKNGKPNDDDARKAFCYGPLFFVGGSSFFLPSSSSTSLRWCNKWLCGQCAFQEGNECPHGPHQLPACMQLCGSGLRVGPKAVTKEQAADEVVAGAGGCLIVGGEVDDDEDGEGARTRSDARGEEVEFRFRCAIACSRVIVNVRFAAQRINEVSFVRERDKIDGMRRNIELIADFWLGVSPVLVGEWVTDKVVRFVHPAMCRNPEAVAALIEEQATENCETRARRLLPRRKMLNSYASDTDSDEGSSSSSSSFSESDPNESPEASLDEKRDEVKGSGSGNSECNEDGSDDETSTLEDDVEDGDIAMSSPSSVAAEETEAVTTAPAAVVHRGETRKEEKRGGGVTLRLVANRSQDRGVAGSVRGVPADAADDDSSSEYETDATIESSFEDEDDDHDTQTASQTFHILPKTKSPLATEAERIQKRNDLIFGRGTKNRPVVQRAHTTPLENIKLKLDHASSTAGTDPDGGSGVPPVLASAAAAPAKISEDITRLRSILKNKNRRGTNPSGRASTCNNTSRRYSESTVGAESVSFDHDITGDGAGAFDIGDILPNFPRTSGRPEAGGAEALPSPGSGASTIKSSVDIKGSTSRRPGQEEEVDHLLQSSSFASRSPSFTLLPMKGPRGGAAGHNIDVSSTSVSPRPASEDSGGPSGAGKTLQLKPHSDADTLMRTSSLATSVDTVKDSPRTSGELQHGPGAGAASSLKNNASAALDDGRAATSAEPVKRSKAGTRIMRAFFPFMKSAKDDPVAPDEVGHDDEVEGEDAPSEKPRESESVKRKQKHDLSDEAIASIHDLKESMKNKVQSPSSASTPGQLLATSLIAGNASTTASMIEAKKLEKTRYSFLNRNTNESEHNHYMSESIANEIREVQKLRKRPQRAKEPFGPGHVQLVPINIDSSLLSMSAGGGRGVSGSSSVASGVEDKWDKLFSDKKKMSLIGSWDDTLHFGTLADQLRESLASLAFAKTANGGSASVMSDHENEHPVSSTDTGTSSSTTSSSSSTTSAMSISGSPAILTDLDLPRALMATTPPPGQLEPTVAQTLQSNFQQLHRQRHLLLENDASITSTRSSVLRNLRALHLLHLSSDVEEEDDVFDFLKAKSILLSKRRLFHSATPSSRRFRSSRKSQSGSCGTGKAGPPAAGAGGGGDEADVDVNTNTRIATAVDEERGVVRLRALSAG